MNAKLATGATILKFLKENKPYLLTVLLTLLLNGTTTFPAYLLMDSESIYQQEAITLDIALNKANGELAEQEKQNQLLKEALEASELKILRLNGTIEVKDELIEILKSKEEVTEPSKPANTDWPF